MYHISRNDRPKDLGGLAMAYSHAEMAKLIGIGDTSVDTGRTVQIWFANGLGLSVAYHGDGYSGEGTCELAAIKRDVPRGWDCVYSRANGWADVRGYQNVWEAIGAAAALAQANPAEFRTYMPSMVD